MIKRKIPPRGAKHSAERLMMFQVIVAFGLLTAVLCVPTLVRARFGTLNDAQPRSNTLKTARPLINGPPKFSVMSIFTSMIAITTTFLAVSVITGSTLIGAITSCVVGLTINYIYGRSADPLRETDIKFGTWTKNVSGWMTKMWVKETLLVVAAGIIIAAITSADLVVVISTAVIISTVAFVASRLDLCHPVTGRLAHLSASRVDNTNIDKRWYLTRGPNVAYRLVLKKPISKLASIGNATTKTRTDSPRFVPLRC